MKCFSLKIKGKGLLLHPETEKRAAIPASFSDATNVLFTAIAKESEYEMAAIPNRRRWRRLEIFIERHNNNTSAASPLCSRYRTQNTLMWGSPGWES